MDILMCQMFETFPPLVLSVLPADLQAAFFQAIDLLPSCASESPSQFLQQFSDVKIVVHSGHIMAVDLLDQTHA